jgi:hypothetical protein
MSFNIEENFEIPKRTKIPVRIKFSRLSVGKHVDVNATKNEYSKIFQEANAYRSKKPTFRVSILRINAMKARVTRTA